MRGLPLRARTIIVVRVDLMIVYVHAGEKRRPRRTAHRRGDVGMTKLGALVPYRAQRFRHEIQRAQFNVLIVGQDQDDVGFAFPQRHHRRVT